MSRFPSWCFVLALAPLVACSNSPVPISQTAPPAAPSPVLSAQDQSFVNSADASDQFEISSSQLALQKSRSPAIRRFAQRMIDDHSKTTQQLAAIAQTKGTNPQPMMTSDQEGIISGLQGASGRAFNADYVRGQNTNHRMAVQVFQTEIASGTDPDLHAFAQQTLPIIQDHLAMAQRLRP